VATFCQICRHPSDEPPGHEPGCPVLTGEPVRGYDAFGPIEINQQDLSPLNQMQQAQGGMMAAGAAYEPEHPFPGSAADFYERNQKLIEENARLKSDLEKHKAALEDIDDHGRALHFIEALRAADKRLSQLTQELITVKAERDRLKNADGGERMIF